MKILTRDDVAQLTLKEMRHRLPEKIIIDSLKWVYPATRFDIEYRKYQRAVDQYWSHLSDASHEETYQLTVEMSGCDATLELQLISAKVLLALQELDRLPCDFATHITNPESRSWMGLFYSRRGSIRDILQAQNLDGLSFYPS